MELELLERTVEEVGAITAIYDTNAPGRRVVIHSCEEYLTAHSIIEAVASEGVSMEWSGTTPSLDVEIELLLHVELNGEEGIPASLRCKLPPGYPRVPVSVVVSVCGLHRSSVAYQKLTVELNQLAVELAAADSEAIMELLQALEERVSEAMSDTRAISSNKSLTGTTVTGSSDEYMCGFGRRWIWAHHIKDSARRKAIVCEAHRLCLGGFLKSGYPGVVVVEGRRGACEEYVQWIKGNKSRPGGFGRNWGHHVRGEINVSIPVGPLLSDSGSGSDSGDTSRYCSSEEVQCVSVSLDEEVNKFVNSHRRLPIVFSDVEDLSVLGRACKECGLDSEFLEYVMQHNS